DNESTRLSLQMKDMEQVDEKALKRQGANGIMKISKKNLQVIVGTTVEFLATAMRKRMDANDMEAPSSSGVSNESETAPKVTKLGSEDFVMPVKGRLMNMTEVPDQVFSQKMMGDGFAVDPKDGLFVSPVDGGILNVFPTKHAIGIRSEQGQEVLVHVGLDTVDLKGEGFDVYVKEGDMVKKGDKLLKVDLSYIREHATATISPIVFTNLNEDDKIKIKQTGIADAGTKDVIEIN